LNLRRAELQLSQAGLNIGQIARSHDPDTETGTVMTQVPSPGDFVARGEAVNVLVSEGRRPLTFLLPEMTGYSAEVVLSSIRTWGLKTGRLLEVESADLSPGTVKALQPPPGSAISQGQTVHLTVTTAPGLHKPSPIVLYRYTSPPGLLDRNLKLVLDREDGESIVYEKDIPAGTSVTIPITVPEEAILKVYLNGSLLEERRVP
ncbi:PASTA domain-containing protein, partial [bacterium]